MPSPPLTSSCAQEPGRARVGRVAPDPVCPRGAPCNSAPLLSRPAAMPLPCRGALKYKLTQVTIFPKASSVHTHMPSAHDMRSHLLTHSVCPCGCTHAHVVSQGLCTTSLRTLTPLLPTHTPLALSYML